MLAEIESLFKSISLMGVYLEGPTFEASPIWNKFCNKLVFVVVMPENMSSWNE